MYSYNQIRASGQVIRVAIIQRFPPSVAVSIMDIEFDLCSLKACASIGVWQQGIKTFGKCTLLQGVLSHRPDLLSQDKEELYEVVDRAKSGLCLKAFETLEAGATPVKEESVCYLSKLWR